VTARLRVAVQYGGSEYLIADRTIDDVLEEIERGLQSSKAAWLEVNVGMGRSTKAKLLLGSAIPIALWAVNSDGPEADREDGAESNLE
jgi:hypothetical protein